MLELLEFLDIFSGIGGFRLGLELAGHKCVGHCEKDKNANKAYNAMYNTKVKGEWYEEDVTKLRSNRIPRADIWCFGFPCQDISISGKKAGINGSRSSVFYTVIKLLKEQEEKNKPKYLLIENVKNLLSINGGWDFADVLSELDQAGYDAEWQICNSKFFGVPQNRERAFIVGHLRGKRGSKVFPITTYSRASDIKVIGSTKPNFRKIGQRDLVYGVDGSIGCLSASDYKQPKQILLGYINTNSQGNRVYDPRGISTTLSSNGGGMGGKTGMYMVSAVMTPTRLEKRQNGRRIKNVGEPMFTLTATDQHGVYIREATKKGYSIADEGDSINLEHPGSQTRRGRVGKSVAQTLTTSCNQATIMNGVIRRLTPLECFRLQGFPDEFFFRAKEAGLSDTALYKCAGNAVTVNVAHAIAKRLK